MKNALMAWMTVSVVGVSMLMLNEIGRRMQTIDARAAKAV